jgi:carboxyl-terminal processing protease
VTTGNLKWLVILFIVCAFCYANARSLRGIRDLALAMNIVDQVYVEPTRESDLYQAAISGMLRSLDANSGYIGQDQLQSFQSIFEQEFGGLGVSLDGPPRRPSLTVVSTIFNSPAFHAGIRPGDVIANVDGQEVRHWTTQEVSSKLRGREGSSVRLLIDRDGETMEKIVVRDRIEIESVLGDRRRSDGTWNFLMQADPRVAYVRIELFGEKTASEFEKAISSCTPKPEALIIDLRDNTGGLLLAAAQICDLFLDDGAIVTTKGRDQRVDDELMATPGAVLPESCPIVIIVNENSASASEILAGCLKDRERAQVVGVRSFGKGSVQNVIPLEGGKAAMRLTTAYYYPPSGRRIHRKDPNSDEGDWGIDPSPNCRVEMSDEQLEATIERFRERSKPIDAEEEPTIDSDESVNVDPQLSFALQLLRQKLNETPE